jgi:hypothetical protein
METTAQPRWPLGRKLAFFLPLAVALALTLAARTQADLHRQIELIIIGNVFGTVFFDRSSRVLDRREAVDTSGNCDADLRECGARFRSERPASCLQISSINDRLLPYGPLARGELFCFASSRKPTRRSPQRATALPQPLHTTGESSVASMGRTHLLLPWRVPS